MRGGGVPRIRRAPAGAGVRVPGIYGALLEAEREKYNRRGEVIVVREGRELRGSWKDRNDHSQGFFLYSRHFLDALEAGGAVTVDRCHPGVRRVLVPDFLLTRKSPGTRWRVSADDVVVLVGSPAVDRPRGPAEFDPDEEDDE
jgi:hypothetical protein